MSFGVYVHVPYCRAVCPYCAFNVVRHKGALPQRELAAALLAEARANAARFSGPIKTIYFGGGTPSLMSPSFFAEVLAGLRAQHAIDARCEITLELEPGTADEATLRELRGLGIHRLSIGWQSQQEDLLQTLGRQHSAGEARMALAQARAAGFDNVSLDWLIAVPQQTKDHLQADLAALLTAEPEHISCYTLTIEPHTPYARRVANASLTPVEDDLQGEYLSMASGSLQRAGYRRYEVSSFAKPGRQSRHNRAYWTGRPYLGIGPGAHSFAHSRWQQALRWQSEKRVAAYLRAWQASEATTPPLSPNALPRHAVIDPLTPLDIARERVLVGLRRTAGVALSEAPLRAYAPALRRAANDLVARRWATMQRGRVVPTQHGLLHADAAAELLLAEV